MLFPPESSYFSSWVEFRNHFGSREECLLHCDCQEISFNRLCTSSLSEESSSLGNSSLGSKAGDKED